jgi:uncharacterized membrane protein
VEQDKQTEQRQHASIYSARPLSPSEFNTAMVHLYRGEVGRANTWRQRLDGTTNWAVLTTGATLSFAFSSSEHTPVMILINSLLILFFLFIEARRYQFYDLWRSRVRLMETEFFADMLTPQTQASNDEEHWRELLAADLFRPHFSITLWEALGRRLRRNYSWIFAVLVLAWAVKIAIHPTPATDLVDLYRRAALGPLPPWFMLLLGALFNGFLILLALATSAWAPQSDETASRQDTRQRMARTPDE